MCLFLWNRDQRNKFCVFPLLSLFKPNRWTSVGKLTTPILFLQFSFEPNKNSRIYLKYILKIKNLPNSVPHERWKVEWEKKICEGLSTLSQKCNIHLIAHCILEFCCWKAGYHERVAEWSARFQMAQMHSNCFGSGERLRSRGWEWWRYAPDAIINFIIYIYIHN